MDIMPIKKSERKAARERVLSLRASMRACLSSLGYTLELEDCNASKQSAVCSTPRVNSSRPRRKSAVTHRILATHAARGRPSRGTVWRLADNPIVKDNGASFAPNFAGVLGILVQDVGMLAD